MQTRGQKVEDAKFHPTEMDGIHTRCGVSPVDLRFRSKSACGDLLSGNSSLRRFTTTAASGIFAADGGAIIEFDVPVDKILEKCAVKCNFCGIISDNVQN